MHPQVRWILRSQLMVTAAAGLVAWLALGLNGALSAVLGGGIATASALAYVWRAFRPSGQTAGDARKAFDAQVAGEACKFAVTLSLFALVFGTYAQLVGLPLFLSYTATMVVYWVALLRQQ